MSKTSKKIQNIYKNIKELSENRLLVNLIKAAIGIVLFLYVMLTLDLSLFAKISITNNFILFFILAILDMVFIVFLLALRWKIVLHNFFDYEMPVRRSFRISFIAKFFSLLTPSRIGDIVRAKYVSELGVLKAVYTVITDRIIELIALFTLALIALIYFKNIPLG
ncbi:MAG: flippase-like domain-containing protein, partial [Candidatus Aenigmatarchaeota archaeon]